MHFLDELEWRGMHFQSTPGVRELLDSPGQVGYIGFDPTAPSLTIGNYVQIMLLKLWQRAGHTPIMLFGGATGRIGDPSFKDKERELKTNDELDINLARQIEQARRLLNFEDGPNKALLVNNYDFYKEMNALDFLRDVGKTVTVAYMMSKESVQRRIETGISFTEFSYQLLQGYDFQVLYDQFQCKVQMGGSDQWGNITTGTEFVSRNLNGKAYAITTPLLTKADGTKFGKSEQGNIWLDPQLTSPYQFYQFWINCDDRDLPKFMRYFTLRSREEVEALELEHAKDPRTLKRLLAEELTARVHSQSALESAQQVSAIVFDPKSSRDALLAMDAGTLTAIGQEIPYFQVPAELLQQGVSVVELLTKHAAIFKSNNEVRQAIKGNALQLNKVRIETHEHMAGSDTWLHQRFVLVENGKKSKYLLEAVS